jgi:ABC-type transporter Mla subunit MlaD
MSITMAMAAGMWQSDGRSVDSHLVMIFIGIVAVALVGQAFVMLGMALGAFKAQKTIQGQIEEIKEKLLPLLDKSNVLMTDLTPQLKQIATSATTISGHVEDISCIVREKIHELSPTISAANETLKQANETAREANQKTREQVDRVNVVVTDQVTRVNGMVTSVLDLTANMGKAIQHGVTQPVREVAGIVDGFKAAVATFFNGRPKPKEPVYRAPVGTYQPGNSYPEDKPGF